MSQIIFITTFSILIALFITSAIATSPLNLGLWILFTALFISLFISTTTSTWFRLLLFLIYIGGILVIFAYFIAISPNQEIRIIPITLMALTISSIIIYLFYSTIPIFSRYRTTTKSLSPRPLFFEINIIILSTLAIVLLLALILVVKVSRRSIGPLRPFFKYVLSITKQPPSH